MKIIDLKDRFARGVVAGLIATLILALLNLFSFHVLGFTDRRYYNFASALIFGKQAELLGEHIYSQLAQIAFGTAMGIIFIYLILVIGSRNLFLKAIIWGMAIEFASFGLAVIVRLEPILPITLGTAISASVNNTFWGIALAWGIQILDKRYEVAEDEEEEQKEPANPVKVKRHFLIPTPARKLSFKDSEGENVITEKLKSKEKKGFMKNWIRLKKK